MAREEYMAALKNAMDRGESLEKAVQSMIASGYNAEEVRDAAKNINVGVISSIKQPKQVTIEQISINSQPPMQTQQPAQQTLETTTKQISYPPVAQPIPQRPEEPIKPQPLPATNGSTYIIKPAEHKRKMPKILIVLLIIFSILLLGLFSLMFLGNLLLNALWG